MTAEIHRPVNVLLIEDSEADARLITRILGKSALRTAVDVAADGVEALERLRGAGGRRPDIIVLDLNMPRMNGFEALPHLRAALPGSRIVILTTGQARDERQRALAAGADAFIVKPERIFRLGDELATALDG